MEADKFVKVLIFHGKDLIHLEVEISSLLERSRHYIEFINSSITYNTDTEEYVILVSFYVLDEIKFDDIYYDD